MNHFKYGWYSELIAIEYLEKYNLVCLEHRYRNIYGEIDVIMSHSISKTLVCVEVKARRNFFAAKGQEELVSLKQQRRYVNAILLYISQNSQYELWAVRFDLLVVFHKKVKEYKQNAWVT